MRGVPVGVTFVTSLPAVGIMECYAFQALDGSFWHAHMFVPLGTVLFGTSTCLSV